MQQLNYLKKIDQFVDIFLFYRVKRPNFIASYSQMGLFSNLIFDQNVYKIYMTAINRANILKEYQFCQENGNYVQILFGSYGNVRLAKCLKTGSIVAIKTVYGILVKKEIQNNIAINHKNIIKLLDYYIDEGNICTWLIFQYPENGKLFHNIKILKERDRVYIYSILRTICEALQCLYYHGILLHQFNPEYIYINKKNNIKICGLEFEQNPEQKKIRNIPLQYMAPQVFRIKHYDEKIYSWTIGIIFYQLIEGRTPFKANNFGQYINQVQKSMNLFNFRPQERQFLSKTLRFDSKQRYKLSQLLNKTIINQNYADSLTKSAYITKKPELPINQKTKIDIQEKPSQQRIKITQLIKIPQRTDRVKKVQNKQARTIQSRIKITEINEIKEHPEQCDNSKINNSNSQIGQNFTHQSTKSNIQILGINNISDTSNPASSNSIQITGIKAFSEPNKSTQSNPNTSGNSVQSTTSIFQKLRQQKKCLIPIGQSKQKISLRELRLKKHDFKLVKPT